MHHLPPHTTAQDGGVLRQILGCRGQYHPRGLGLTPTKHAVTAAAAVFHLFLTCVSAGVAIGGTCGRGGNMSRAEWLACRRGQGSGLYQGPDGIRHSPLLVL